jgi:hypothetical protein
MVDKMSLGQDLFFRMLGFPPFSVILFVLLGNLHINATVHQTDRPTHEDGLLFLKQMNTLWYFGEH